MNETIAAIATAAMAVGLAVPPPPPPPAARPRVLHIGRRMARLIDVPENARRVHNKASRRLLRREAIRQSSRIERAIRAAQQDRADAREVTKNGHAARRLLEAERAHRRASR